SGTGTFVGSATVTTNASGDAVIALTSTVVGNVGITATVNGSAITFGSPAVVQFVAGAPDTSSNKTLLSIVTNYASANGLATNSVKAHIADKNGNPVANATVTFAIVKGAGTFVGSATITTDSAGDAVMKITSLIADSVSIGATVNGHVIVNGSPAVVIFTNSPDVNNDSTYLSVLIDRAVADGQSVTSVKAHIVDQNGNPLANQNIVFAIDSGSGNIITPQPAMTDANGDAVIEITSTKAGYVLITAQVNNLNIVHGSPARVKFVPVNIYVPRVFTPNGDGKNDVLKPILVGISAFHYFTVYNRWGNIVFTTSDPGTGWDGTFKGVPQPVETYLWVGEGVDSQGSRVVQKGMVSLVR
ncbi:MAG: Ig-like domain-containing protein, partial [Bacteroidetes bacterium]|nr:Ig-like domain-containing protein [Bacteroidota bacterium]